MQDWMEQEATSEILEDKLAAGDGPHNYMYHQGVGRLSGIRVPMTSATRSMARYNSLTKKGKYNIKLYVRREVGKAKRVLSAAHQVMLDVESLI